MGLLDIPPLSETRVTEIVAEKLPLEVSKVNLNRPTRSLPGTMKNWRTISYGQINPAKAGTWRSTQGGVGIDVVFDPGEGRYAMIYSGDDHSGTVGNSRFGINYSDDLDLWDNPDTYPNPIFGPNPVAGTPDHGGVTFPQLVWDNGLWYMFYIAFPTEGFEVGTSTICVATCPTLSRTDSDWTRRGLMLHPNNVPWIQSQYGAQGVIYRPNVVNNGDGTWGMFFNGGKYGTETIGYASADNLLGPWTSLSDPVLDEMEAPQADGLVSDPDVHRIGDDWYMYMWVHYTGGQVGVTGHTVLAHTTAAEYPLGWKFFPNLISGGIRPVYVEGPNGPRLFLFGTGASGTLIREPKTSRRQSGVLTVLASQNPLSPVGSWPRGTDTARPLGLFQYNSSNAVGNKISYDLDLSFGKYYPDFVVQKSSQGGIVTVSGEGMQTFSFDTYSATTTQSVVSGPEFSVFRSGRRRVTFEVTSKNASSGGYQFNFSALSFIQTRDPDTVL